MLLLAVLCLYDIAAVFITPYFTMVGGREGRDGGEGREGEGGEEKWEEWREGGREKCLESREICPVRVVCSY